MIAEHLCPVCPDRALRSATIGLEQLPPRARRRHSHWVGFFDIIHGQTGVAPNGIELHPVLRFSNSTRQPVG